ncbi:CLUMA_CG000377, isoform A [Clunio marinus]|uniref:CLUMA_CG000377, isoform A n=1 Tax=Clunio marinus TaxID=568069 RepID=A0A1J1HIU1_9DIPT|nr:CLUMA_CG000377, isoform A [Clunio marinus]
MSFKRFQNVGVVFGFRVLTRKSGKLKTFYFTDVRYPNAIQSTSANNMDHCRKQTHFQQNITFRILCEKLRQQQGEADGKMLRRITFGKTQNLKGLTSLQK